MILPKTDLLEKRKWSQKVTELFNSGTRLRFSGGCWRSSDGKLFYFSRNWCIGRPQLYDVSSRTVHLAVFSFTETTNLDSSIAPNVSKHPIRLHHALVFPRGCISLSGKTDGFVSSVWLDILFFFFNLHYSTIVVTSCLLLYIFTLFGTSVFHVLIAFHLP